MALILLLLWIAVFIGSLGILTKSADLFTESAEKVGIYLGIPPFIVGVTIVAIGTSLPELSSSIFAVLRNSSEIVVGNVVGSNICNIFLILGIVAVFSRKVIKVDFELTHIDLPLLIGSAFFLALAVWDGVFTLAEALLCIAGITLYLLYTINVEKKYKGLEKRIKIRDGRRKLDRKHIIILVITTFSIYFGAKYTIESVIRLSDLLNIGKEIIALSVVAFGTSLPELTVSLAAVKKGKGEIAVGNILGSNIFNSFAVMGIPALIGTLIIPRDVLVFSLPVMLVATLLYFFITQDKQITKWEGWLLIIFYVFFIGKLFGMF